ncbi:MAG TPA: 3-dehydroquinate synthase [Trueperaceae bacterium]
MKLDVALTPPYPVHVEGGLLGQLGRFVREKHIALISDEHVAPLYADTAQAALAAAGKTSVLYTVPAGEDSKSLETFGRLLRAMVESGFDRTGAVLALGGGVIGDLAGFVAASYMRGLPFYQCPTSLLAMVDASVGGKTAINLPEGKNLVGAFWQPQAVLADTDALASLPAHEFRQGAVELFKAGLLADPSILADVTDPAFRPDGPRDFLTSLIGRAIAVKAAVVAADEREMGTRAILNLGHTLAHALEAESGHVIPHGDAVAYGLLFMAELSRHRGFADETARISRFLEWVHPRPLGAVTFEALRPYVERDKKHRAGRQRWVLLEEVGKPVVVDDIHQEELTGAWKFLQTVLPPTPSEVP